MFLSLLAAFSVTAHAASLSPAQRAADFDALKALFDSQYSMAAVKKELFGLDFNAAFDKHRDAAVNAKSDEDFMAELQKTVGELRDAHVSLARTTDLKATLGFRVDKFGDKAIVTEIDRDTLTTDFFPINIGDELVSMDGVPVKQIAQQNAALHRGANDESELGYAYITLTKRSGKFFPVPSGDVQLKFVLAKDGREFDLGLPWIRVGKGFDGFMGRDFKPVNLSRTSPLTMRADFIDIDGTVKAQGSDAIRTELPTPAEAEIVSADPLAYVIKTDKGPMGFVRLDTFAPDDVVQAFAAYSAIFKKMQDKANGVVIDMRGNGGGSILYGFTLASLLVDHPIPAETISWRVTRSRILDFRSEVASTKNAAEQAEDKYLLADLEKAFSEGRPTTEFLPMLVGNTINPDADVNFTKPLVLLIDDQCYSMCDFFSALMQDAKRATLVGVPTAAAGGPVSSFAALPYSEMTPRLTIGIGRRPNGGYIENRPVQPDVLLPMDASDVAHGYAKYIDGFWGVLKAKIN